MTGSAPASTASVFFMDAAAGQRFCVYHPPSSRTPCRGAIVCVPPFGEEMNRSRRISANMARTLADAGFGVLRIDLLGCGDSSGELREATWEIWRQDIAAAKAWIERRVGMTAALWALRLGALLALDFVRTSQSIERLVLWQPVLSGKSYLTQLLRTYLAADLLDTGRSMSRTTELRDTLLAGNSLEIAGYDITPEMACALDALNAEEFSLPPLRIDWFDVVSSADSRISPGRLGTAKRWEASGGLVNVHPVHSQAFWSSQEICEAPELVAATLRILTEATR